VAVNITTAYGTPLLVSIKLKSVVALEAFSFASSLGYLKRH
jgi:hypothetical protein